MEGILQGHRILIPRHVQAMDKFERKLWIAERGITHLHEPHWDGPGTSFSGAETLASMTASAAAVGPNAGLLSLLTRECLEPIAPSYLSRVGNRFWMRAYGIVDTTTVVPTFQFQIVAGPTYANPLTSGQMLAQDTAASPGISLTGNLEWWVDVMLSVRAVGSSGSIIAAGTMINDLAIAGTYVVFPFKNATPPTAVVFTGTGGLLVPIYFDLELIMGAATAGNTATCLEYSLMSLN
jgi:hypothetical protein